MALRKPLYSVEKDATPHTVCVTGATGYIAAPIIARLLAAGHTVHATCRDPAALPKLRHIKNLPGASDRLKLFKADLEVDGSFDEALQGCHYLIHTAAVVRMMAPPGKERALIIDPSVRGVKNVLGTVNKFESIKKVIMTSSVAAVVGNHGERGRKHVYTEDDWNLSCSDTYLPYHQAKKLSEEVAVKIEKEQNRWKLVVINPSLVCGPPLGNMKCESVGFMRKLLQGSYSCFLPNVTYCVVDVDDVAAAHTLAMVVEHAQGRYLITNESFTLRQYVNLLKRRWSAYPLPWLSTPFILLWLLSKLFLKGLDLNLMKAIWGIPPHFDNTKSKKDLGMTYIDIETSQNDMVEALLALGIIKPRPNAAEIQMTPVRKND